jgi:hypothetical protein
MRQRKGKKAACFCRTFPNGLTSKNHNQDTPVAGVATIQEMATWREWAGLGSIRSAPDSVWLSTGNVRSRPQQLPIFLLPVNPSGCAIPDSFDLV